MKNKKVPVVIFDRVKLRNAVSYWFNKNLKSDDNIEHKFGLLLLKIGFSEENTVKFLNYDKDAGAFNYVINKLKSDNINDRIRLLFPDDKYCNPAILLSRDGFNVKYRCFRKLNGQIDTNAVIPVYYEMCYPNGCYYRRTLSDNAAKYTIKFNDYRLELSFSKRNVNDRALVPDNEKQLEDYLSNLSFPLNVEVVYKTICGLSLGSGADYIDFSLNVSKFNESLREYDLTDSIVFSKGNLVQYIVGERVKPLDELSYSKAGKVRKKIEGKK